MKVKATHCEACGFVICTSGNIGREASDQMKMRKANETSIKGETDGEEAVKTQRADSKSLSVSQSGSVSDTKRTRRSNNMAVFYAFNDFYEIEFVLISQLIVLS